VHRRVPLTAERDQPIIDGGKETLAADSMKEANQFVCIAMVTVVVSV